MYGLLQEDAIALLLALSGELSDFVTIPDRTHQGVLNHLVFMRLMRGAFVSDPNVLFGGSSVLDPTRAYYWGISGGGVTAGIDFGLTVAAELAGEEVAKSIQLVLEYDPQPPFDSGSPEKAGVERVKRIRERLSGLLQSRQKANDDAAARLA